MEGPIAPNHINPDNNDDNAPANPNDAPAGQPAPHQPPLNQPAPHQPAPNPPAPANPAGPTVPVKNPTTAFSKSTCPSDNSSTDDKLVSLQA